MHSLTALLHLMQPLARLWGRFFCCQSAARSRASPQVVWPVRKTAWIWSECWQTSEQRLKSIESDIRHEGGMLVRGGDYDRWDFELRGGYLAGVRLYMTVEEHGAGRQMFRFRLMPYYTHMARLAVLPPALLAGAAIWDQVWAVAAVFIVLSVCAAGLALLQCASAIAMLERVLALQRGMPAAGISQAAGNGRLTILASAKKAGHATADCPIGGPVA